MKPKSYLKVLFLLLALLASSCNTSKFSSSDAITSSFSGGVQIVHSADEVNVSNAVKQTFNEHLAHNLFCHKGFNHGSDITVEYHFVSFNRGSRILKCLGGGLGQCGEGSLTIEATCKSRQGDVLGVIQSDARIGSSLIGRAIDQAIFEAAEEIASYANSLLNKPGKSLT